MRRCVLALTLLVVAGSVHAAETEFLSSVNPTDRVSSGISHLSPAQQAALAKCANRDITLAREGDVTGFSGSFTERRTDEERHAAGIDTLTRPERDILDALVANAISYHPMTYQAQVAAPPPPKASPPPSLVLTQPKMQIHGDLSLTVGAGSGGGSFFGTAMDVSMTDPSGKFTLAVGYSVVRSKGLPPWYFDPYGPYAPYGPYVGPGPLMGPPLLP
jgi:hypothetical protein